jgi:hypothetical protein
MDDQAKQIIELLERLSATSDSDAQRGIMHTLQALQKETTKDLYSFALKQGLLQELKKSNNTLVSIIKEIEPSILEQQDVKEELIKINNNNKLKGWEV